MHAWFSWGDLRKRDYLDDLGADGGVILKWIFKKYAAKPSPLRGVSYLVS